MDQKRWVAVQANDPSADGMFFYGVKTTRIFCLPSCKSKLPLAENVVFFESAEQALELGFRPCKRCRPDLYPQPPLHEVLLTAIKTELDRQYDHPISLHGLAQRFGMSSSHLVRIFKDRYGATPHEYLRTRRLELAKDLLRASDLKTVEVALRCGFTCYSTFFTNFKSITGMTPEEYREGGNL